jgi:hypothetical protein
MFQNANNYIILLRFWRNKLFVLLWELKHNGMSLIKIMQHLSISAVCWEHIPFITTLGDRPVFMAHTLATLISRPQSARIVSVGTHEILGVLVKTGNVRVFTLLYIGCWRTVLMNRSQSTCLTDRGAVHACLVKSDDGHFEHILQTAIFMSILVHIPYLV